VPHDEDRLEVDMTRRTLADVHRDEGRLEGALIARKQMLVDLLPLRFKSLPEEMEHTIKASQDADKLAEWLRGIITAKDLDSIGILPPR
jgi:hypothetical protein